MEKMENDMEEEAKQLREHIEPTPLSPNLVSNHHNNSLQSSSSSSPEIFELQNRIKVEELDVNNNFQENEEELLQKKDEFIVQPTRPKFQEKTENCNGCSSKFTILSRWRHCRGCGLLFCIP